MKQLLSHVPPTPEDEDHASSAPPSPASLAELEIGLPLTGRCNLAESPLLQLVGDLQWKAISRISGVPSKEIHDKEGARLYATFFFAETRFDSAQPMAAFGENDHLTIATDMSRFGVQMIEGRHYLLSKDEDGTLQPIPESPKAAVRQRVPFVRLANNFVKQTHGPARLANARPANEGIKQIARKQYPPVSYLLLKKAERFGTFFKLPESFIPLHATPLRTEYEIVPDRDLNGVGLLYFANYPLVLDICERRLLGGLDHRFFSPELLNKRTVVHRRSAYYGNATADERLLVEMNAWIANPFLGDAGEPGADPIELRLEFRMTRRSDRNLMMVSSAKKLIYGTALGHTDLIDRLAGQPS
jgi:probable biosynthetic protein (TIGR04098 family)